MARLKAVSVIETVAAMVIILLVFWVAGSVFYFTFSKKESKKRHKAAELAEIYFSEKRYIGNENDFPTFLDRDLTIEAESIVHDNIPGVREWIVKVYDKQNKLVITRNRFIKNEEK